MRKLVVISALWGGPLLGWAQSLMAGHALGILFRLARATQWPIFPPMELKYTINFVGHDEWLNSGYEPKLSQGDVVTRDGEFLGTWRVVDYDHEDEYSSGRLEFVLVGENMAKFVEDFGMINVRTSYGLALSQLLRTIRKWHEHQPT